MIEQHVCMNCKREPIGEPYENGDMIYYMVIPPGEEEPVVLMSNFEECFQMYTEPNFIPKEGETFICLKCFDAMVAAEGQDGLCDT